MAPPAAKKPNARKPKSASRSSSKDILAAVPDMIFVVDREGRYLDFKPAKGLEPYVPVDEFMGHLVAEILPRAVADPLLALIGKTLNGGETESFRYELPERGRVNSYEARIVLFNANAVLVVVRDVSPGGRHPVEETGRRAYSLTDREIAVLGKVASGRTDKAIAQELLISPMTVRKHVASIRKKMGAQSRTEASVRALKEGLLA